MPLGPKQCHLTYKSPILRLVRKRFRGSFAQLATGSRPAWRLRSSRRSRFEADFVVYHIAKTLLAAEVSLRRLNAHMAKEKLDLLPAGFVAQTGAYAAKVARSDILQATFRASGVHHAPDYLWTESGVANALGFIEQVEI